MPGGKERQRDEQGDGPVIARLAHLGHEEAERGEHQRGGQPQRPSTHPSSQRIDQGHGRQGAGRTGESDDPLVATAGEGHQRGDDPAGQGRLLQTGAPLDLGHEPVLMVNRVDRFGRERCSRLPHKSSEPRQPRKTGGGEHTHHDLGPGSTPRGLVTCTERPGRHGSPP